MPRWLKLVRGMIGIGLTFALGVGVVVTLIGGVAWLGGKASPVEVLATAGKFAVVSFLLGVVFSGVLALVARSRRFSNLSVRMGAILGAGAGLAYFIFLAMNGGRNWTPRLAVVNFVLLLGMGSVSAVATLLIARRARSALDAGDDAGSLTSVSEAHALGAAENESSPAPDRVRVEVRDS